MKINILIRNLDDGGAQRQVVNFAKSMDEFGHDISICVYYARGVFEKYLKNTGVKVVSLEKKHRWDLIRFLYSLIILVRKERPDVLHSYLGTANILSVLVRYFIPATKIVWGVRASNTRLSNYDWFWRFSYLIERFLSRYSDLIIVNSYAGMKYSEIMGFPRKKMVVISNGIDIEKFRPDQEKREKIRKQWRVPESEKIIGLVARLDPKKSHETFIRAAASIVAVRSDVKFVCIGREDDSQYSKMLYRMTYDLGLEKHLAWMGSVNNMEKIYNGLDILCLSSAYGEGFPNVIGEAMACGVPCVATNVGDCRFIIGDLGIIVPPEEPKSLAGGIKKMLNLIEKEEKSISLKTRKRIVEKFSVKKMVIDTEKELIRICP